MESKITSAVMRYTSLLLPILTWTPAADGFLLNSMGIPVPVQRKVTLHQSTADDADLTENININQEDHTHRWKHEPFDFSSKYGWNDFYKNGIENGEDSIDSSSTTSSSTPTFVDGIDTIESLAYEWHPHIPHSTIIDAIQPSIIAASQHYAKIQQQSTSTQTTTQRTMPSILLVGCGNSALPRILHDAFDTPVQVTCLDYSPVCIEMIQSMYKDSCPNMNFVVGDATDLQNVAWNREEQNDNDDNDVKLQNQEFDTTSLLKEETKEQFDVIVDKGLLDALMCGEGFDMARLMSSINSVLTQQNWGIHVLICFQLSKASKQSLMELGHGLEWDFTIPVEGSERGRACFNLARRFCNEKDKRGFLEIDQIATEWV